MSLCDWFWTVVHISPGGGSYGCAGVGGDEVLQGRIGGTRGHCQAALDLAAIEFIFPKDNKIQTLYALNEKSAL